MQTRILLLAALSIAAPAIAQNTVPAQLRIDPAVQRQRDQTRVGILQDEVVAEALSLAEAQELLRSDAVRADARAAQEATKRIARHRQNISQLARELALADRQAAVASRPPPLAASISRATSDQIPSGYSAPPLAHIAPEQRRAVTGSPPEWVISGKQATRAP